MAKNTVSLSDRIDPDKYPVIAEEIVETYKARKKDRGDLEKQWAEVDRQLAMKPEKSHKLNADGNADKDRAWMPEIELPLQAQTLEMLTADVRRLKFPKGRNWFKARAALTDDYIEAFRQARSIFPGERGQNDRTAIDQDNGDRIAEAFLADFHRQYDFRGNIGMIDAEALKYSCGVGRLRNVKRKMLGHEVTPIGGREQTIPVYVPRSIKNVYLDDSQHALMHEGVVLGPNIIQVRSVKLVDLKAAAEQGGEGYIPEQISRLEGDKHGNVLLVELEGDLVHETSQDTVIERDVVVTASMGKRGDKSVFGLVRVEKGEGFCSYNIHKYHGEGPDDPYGTSPLLKGMPVAKIAAQTMNRIMESAQLKNTPPVGYSSDDPEFASSGGPVVEPYAQWPSVDGINVYDEVGGDPGALFEVFSGFVSLYADVTGVNPPRLGAQTKSHTTAFAKDVELQQGAVRTVDYTNSDLEGPMSRLLALEYRMGRKGMSGQRTIFVEAWDEFIQVQKAHLPPVVNWRAIGAGAPAEDALQQQNRLQSMNFALQLDAASQQAGNPPTIDIPTMIKQVLSAGGWQDVEAITLESDTTGGAGGLPGQGLAAL